MGLNIYGAIIASAMILLKRIMEGEISYNNGEIRARSIMREAGICYPSFLRLETGSSDLLRAMMARHTRDSVSGDKEKLTKLLAECYGFWPYKSLILPITNAGKKYYLRVKAKLVKSSDCWHWEGLDERNKTIWGMDSKPEVIANYGLIEGWELAPAKVAGKKHPSGHVYWIGRTDVGFPENRSVVIDIQNTKGYNSNQCGLNFNVEKEIKRQMEKRKEITVNKDEVLKKYQALKANGALEGFKGYGNLKKIAIEAFGPEIKGSAKELTQKIEEFLEIAETQKAPNKEMQKSMEKQAEENAAEPPIKAEEKPEAKLEAIMEKIEEEVKEEEKEEPEELPKPAIEPIEEKAEVKAEVEGIMSQAEFERMFKTMRENQINGRSTVKGIDRGFDEPEFSLNQNAALMAAREEASNAIIGVQNPGSNLISELGKLIGVLSGLVSRIQEIPKDASIVAQEKEKEMVKEKKSAKVKEKKASKVKEAPAKPPEEASAEPRKRGRPKGSKNKTGTVGGSMIPNGPKGAVSQAIGETPRESVAALLKEKNGKSFSARELQERRKMGAYAPVFRILNPMVEEGLLVRVKSDDGEKRFKAPKAK